MKFCILVADNDPDSLATHAEFLEMSGYRVLTATNPSEAQSILDTRRVHLAIVDLRLTDDYDPGDRSGLVLAKATARSIPKLILTKFPTYQDVREALKLDDAALPPAIDFLNKSDGLERLAEAVEQAIDHHVRINQTLVIEPNERNPISFTHLVTLIESQLEGSYLVSRAEEMEDLFRRLFYDSERIRIGRLLWQRNGRVALSVFAFGGGKAPESIIMVLGKVDISRQERDCYGEFAPKAPGHSSTVLRGSSDTVHFAANMYAVAELDLENAHRLIDAYHSYPEKTLHTSLIGLLENTLAEWHQEKLVLEEARSLDQVYRDRLDLGKEHLSPQSYQERVNAILRQVPTIGEKVEVVSGKVVVKFGGRVFSYPDPAEVLYGISSMNEPVILINTPGLLTGENILTDSSTRTWVTDFARAGLAPALWNLTSLEACIRFDWIDATKLQWLHDLEVCLIEGEFSRLDLADVEQPLRKAVRAIQIIRRISSAIVGKDAAAYHVALFFHAAKRIADYNPSFSLMPNELTRLAHSLMAAAMICDHVSHGGRRGSIGAAASDGIRINKPDRVVWVDGIRIQLRGQSYELLEGLYDRANRLCTRREIVEQILRGRYDETDGSQISRLNTAIRRLREKIEDDPDHPRFLVTEPGEGYRLITRPGK